ncbi:MAG: MBL fold metallo-hydrolase [Thiolinea sp.]
MKIKLYGVRGSIASPSVETVRYGGNTACVSVEGNDGTRLIFDAGTGIRILGDDLVGQQPLHLFFSHYHWDHIQGFPFFRPAYETKQDIFLLADHLPESPRSILEQMADPHFPVPVDALKANIQVMPILDQNIHIGEFQVSTIAANHPGGCCAYRVDSPQGSFVYITDNELVPPTVPKTSYQQWVEFVHGVDLFLHDAMYLDEERDAIHGWGHSLISQMLKLAVDAEVKNAILFHHDPSRTDQQLDKIQRNSRRWVKQQDPDMTVYTAREGDVYKVCSNIVRRRKQ